MDMRRAGADFSAPVMVSSQAMAQRWRDELAKVEQADVLPADPADFAFSVTARPLGGIQLIALASDAARIERRATHIGVPRARWFSFLLVDQGTVRILHHGRDIALAAGDMALCDSNAPYAFDLDASARVFMVRVPDYVMRKYLPSPETFCGLRLSAGQGLSAAASVMLQSLCQSADMAIAAEFHDRVAQHVLELLATCFAMTFDSMIGRSSVISSHHVKVKLFIEQNLRDPELSPSGIARKLSLSSRYLRMIFAVGEETVSAYILRRRLEECARQMADPRWRGHSITEIAFGWGFNSAPHFTRSFRNRFATSPREYRRQRLAEAGLGDGEAARALASLPAAA